MEASRKRKEAPAFDNDITYNDDRRTMRRVDEPVGLSETSIEASLATTNNNDIEETAVALDLGASSTVDIEIAAVLPTQHTYFNPQIIVANEVSYAVTSNNGPIIAPRKGPAKPSTPEELACWNRMFFELMLYRIKNGNVNVKSTEEEHYELHQWIVQLRKNYKTREKNPSESTLTEEQISVLESIRFAFTTRGENHWHKNYEKLKEYKADHGHVLVPRQCEIPGLGDWVTSQRQQYQEYTKGKPTPLTKQRKELLDEIGFQFRIRNRPEWMTKHDELLIYKEENGHTRVPQHYTPNKALGKWVAKQREQYKLYKKGKHSFLTPDRLEKLNTIGFVWSVRGEPSVSTTLSDKVDSTAAAAVHEEKVVDEGAAAAAAAGTAVVPVPVSTTVPSVNEEEKNTTSVMV
mmetsp:Transcript_5084/g.5875  ORF Transcript_5084/g.5875 Transcript_5084/m.5875 type:complete len:405 (+) Transcript_5084:26-1240(+)|eukprot:CAMPEP_0170975652 /NCGR_PEP_ID=MMETSP0735-20130129/48249_1 /TAXON_ID=186038 /ORGANISM="Fragilariopsis kerguelensis, Strain L26-C5" /LENGTH=404 /DNA_ID=CAMNT_0011397449 /DNA_START=22 /DNA_END=1236 /DNA_ORIENTATION=-